MSTRAVALLCGALALVSCTRSESPAADRSGDAALAHVLSGYVVDFLRRNPTTNTYLGGAGLDPSLRDVDGMLRDHSARALEDEDGWLRATQRAIEAVDVSSLSPNARIDREVALAQIRFLLRQHGTRRYQERALDTYVSEPFRALDWQIQGLTQTGDGSYGTADEWRLVIRRVAAVPPYLETARQQLYAGVESGRIPDWRMAQRDGLNTSEANARYFAETLPTLAADRIAGPERDRLLAELGAAAARASEAYVKFREFIAAAYFSETQPKDRTDRFAMGEEEYHWAINNNFRVSATPSELYEASWPVVETTRTQMVDLAREIGRRQKWRLPDDGPAAVRAVFDQLSKDYPRSDAEMVAWYRDTGVRLVEYGRRTGMFDIPADYRLEVVETPPPLQASIDGAAYYPAPPFKSTGIGRFYVTPTHDDEAALRGNNRASLAYLAAHEGFPGHDWYFKVLTESRGQISPVRWLTPGAVEDSSSMWQDSMPAEGWGLYAEALMAEPQPGAPTGFYTPEERLYQLQGKLYRDLRVRVDTGIHTGRLNYDDAVTLFSEVVDFLPGSCAPYLGPAAARTSGRNTDDKRASCESAERAIFRYSKWPTQAITYRLGREQIEALRAEAAGRLGNRFSLRTFHLLFIRQGTIPSGYFREALLSELAQTQGGS